MQNDPRVQEGVTGGTGQPTITHICSISVQAALLRQDAPSQRGGSPRIFR